MSAPLRDRVDDLVSWARSRIAACRGEGRMFPHNSRYAIEAVQEERTLRAVLLMLGKEAGPLTPPGEDRIQSATEGYDPPGPGTVTCGDLLGLRREGA